VGEGVSDTTQHRAKQRRRRKMRVCGKAPNKFNTPRRQKHTQRKRLVRSYTVQPDRVEKYNKCGGKRLRARQTAIEEAHDASDIASSVHYGGKSCCGGSVDCSETDARPLYDRGRSAPVVCGRRESIVPGGGMPVVLGGDGASGVRVFCWSRELAVMSTSTSLESGPVISTACATALCVATETSLTVTCVEPAWVGGRPAESCAAAIAE